MDTGETYGTFKPVAKFHSVRGILLPLHRGIVSGYMAALSDNQVPTRSAHTHGLDELSTAQAWLTGTAFYKKPGLRRQTDLSLNPSSATYWLCHPWAQCCFI